MRSSNSRALERNGQNARSIGRCEKLSGRLDDNATHILFVSPTFFTVNEADVAVSRLICIGILGDESAGERFIVKPQRTPIFIARLC